MGSRDVLYIAQDRADNSIYDRGSRACVGIIEASGVDVLVQNVNVLQEKNVTLPDWLTGTPSFVDIDSKQVFRGSHAIRRLREKVSKGRDGDEDRVATEKARKGGAADDVQGMLAPSQRFVTGEGSGDDDDPISDIPSAQASGGTVREGSVTESELQAYMQQRDAAIPPGNPEQQ